jgi:hypothetical protein
MDDTMTSIRTNSWYSTHFGSRDSPQQQLVYIMKFHGKPLKESYMVVWYQPTHGWTFFENVPVPNWDWEEYTPTERDWQVSLASVFQHWGKVDD